MRKPCTSRRSVLELKRVGNTKGSKTCGLPLDHEIALFVLGSAETRARHKLSGRGDALARVAVKSERATCRKISGAKSASESPVSSEVRYHRDQRLGFCLQVVLGIP